MISVKVEKEFPDRQKRVVRRRYKPNDPDLKLILQTVGESKRVVGTFLEYDRTPDRNLVAIEILVEENI